MIHVRPPQSLASLDFRSPTVFLAGSIDMGAAPDWQARFVMRMAHRDVTLLNPRRDDWNPEWGQSVDSPNFREQVQWEMAALERAYLIFLHLTSDSAAPISLLELGLHARDGKIVIACDPGFYRRGNVEIVACRYRIPLFDSFDAGVCAVDEWLDRWKGGGRSTVPS